MNNLKLFLAVLCSFLIPLGCVKDDFKSDQRIEYPNSGEIITTSVQGRVITPSGVNGNHLVYADVIVGGMPQTISVTTNDFGGFFFENIKVAGSTLHIYVESPGYFRADRRIPVIEGQSPFIEIQLETFRPNRIISSSEGGVIRDNLGTVELQPDGFIDSNENKYDGDVEVYVHYIDPTRENIASIIQGDLSGIDIEGNVQGLISYGMLQVELRSPDGEKLNINSEYPATLKFRIPNDLRSNAPESIPLWVLDEDSGYWIEEGSAVKNGDEYECEVTHFSSFNVDVKVDPISICGQVCTVLDGNNVDLSNFQVFVKLPERGRIGGWLNRDGKFLFFNFPKDVEFTLCVLDDCGNELFSKIYGPFQEDKDLGKIMIGIFPKTLSQIKGKVLDCDGEPLEDGLVYLEGFRGQQYLLTSTDENGHFSALVDICISQEYSISLFDREKLRYSKQYSFIADRQVDMGTLAACNDGDPTSHIFFEINGVRYLETGLSRDSTRTFVGLDPSSTYTTDGILFKYKKDEDRDGLTYAVVNFFTLDQGAYYSYELGSIDVTLIENDPNEPGRLVGRFEGMLGDNQDGPFETPVAGYFVLPLK